METKRVTQTKFKACLLGLFVTTVLALVGKMDGNVTMALSIVIGGYYGGDSYITGKALANGKADE